MTGEQTLIRQRDWTAVARAYVSSAPFNYAVLDDFLDPEECVKLRDTLLAQWAWHYKSPYARELYLRQPNIPQPRRIADELQTCLPSILAGMEFVEHWAFLHHQNHGLVAHSDVGAVSLDLWLTPDECNLTPGAGGLVLYDVKRPDALSVFEFQKRQWVDEYVTRETSGKTTTIPYAYNRAVLFDARTIHSSDTLVFDGSSSETYRMNFNLLFDDPAKYAARPAYYARRFALMEKIAVDHGMDLDSLDLASAERLWIQAESHEKGT